MRRGLIVGGVLGLGTGLVFGLAAVTATLFPSGAVISAQWDGRDDGGWQRVGPGDWIDRGPVVVPIDGGGKIQVLVDDAPDLPGVDDPPRGPDLTPIPLR
jgi:hypothetical protein